MNVHAVRDLKASDDPEVLREAIGLLEAEVDAEKEDRERLESTLEEIVSRMGRFESFSSTIESQTKRLQAELKTVARERDGLAMRLSEEKESFVPGDRRFKGLLAQYETEQRRMQGELEKAEEDKLQRQKTIESLQTERDTIREELAKKPKDEDMKKLQEEVKRLSISLKENQTLAKAKDDQLKDPARNAEMTDLRARVKQLAEELERAKMEAANARQAADSVKEQNGILTELQNGRELKARNANVEKDAKHMSAMARVKAENEQLSSEISALQGENDFVKADLARLEKELGDLHEVRLELERARSQAELERREHADDKRLLDEFEEDLGAMRAQIPVLMQEHRHKLDAVLKELSTAQEDMDALKETHRKELEIAAEDARKRVTALETEVASVKDLSAAAERKAEEIETALSTKRGDMDALKETHRKELQASAEVAQRRVTATEQEMAALKVLSSAAERKVLGLETTLETMSEAMAESETRANKYERDLQSMVETSALTEENYTRERTKVKALEKTISEMERALDPAGFNASTPINVRIRSLVFAVQQEQKAKRDADKLTEKMALMYAHGRREIMETRARNLREEVHCLRELGSHVLI